MEKEIKKLEKQIASLNDLIDFLYSGGNYTLYYDFKKEVLEIYESEFDPEKDKEQLRHMNLFSDQIIEKYGDDTNDFLEECEKKLDELNSTLKDYTEIEKNQQEYNDYMIEADHELWQAIHEEVEE